MSNDMKSRGWIVHVLDMSDKIERRMTIATAEPIDVNAARRVAEAAYRKKADLTPGHAVMAGQAQVAKVGDVVPSPECSTQGCPNTARPDGQCGKCFHAAKQAVS